MPRQEYHPVQGAYVDSSSTPDPFITALRAELRSTAWPEVTPLDRVREAADAVGGTVTLYTFDGGQTVTVTVPHLPGGVNLRQRFTAEWGDEKSAAELALDWLGYDERPNEDPGDGLPTGHYGGTDCLTARAWIRKGDEVEYDCGCFLPYVGEDDPLVQHVDWSTE